MELLLAAGLEKDCPFVPASEFNGVEAKVLTEDSVEGVDEASFMDYSGKIITYLQVCPSIVA